MPEDAAGREPGSEGYTGPAEGSSDTPPAEARHGGIKGFFSRLRHLNKGQLLMIGIAGATLLVGFLAYRVMRAGGASGSNALANGPGGTATGASALLPDAPPA